MKRAIDADHLALSVWIRMLKAHNVVFRRARERMAPFCTMAQFDVLAQLSREEHGITPAELSRLLLVTAGNLTGLLDRMERAQLVKRMPDEKDRRMTRVTLTDKGKTLALKIMPIHSQDIQEILGGLNAGELRKLRGLLDKLTNTLQEKTK